MASAESRLPVRTSASAENILTLNLMFIGAAALLCAGGAMLVVFPEDPDTDASHHPRREHLPDQHHHRAVAVADRLARRPSRSARLYQHLHGDRSGGSCCTPSSRCNGWSARHGPGHRRAADQHMGIVALSSSGQPLRARGRATGRSETFRLYFSIRGTDRPRRGLVPAVRHAAAVHGAGAARDDGAIARLRAASVAGRRARVLALPRPQRP